MERKRYLEWSISAADLATHDPFGYLVEWGSDRALSSVLASDNSFNGLGGLEYQPAGSPNFIPFPTAGVTGAPSPVGWPVRVPLSAAKDQSLVVYLNGTLHRLNHYGWGILESQDLNLTGRWLAVDSATNTIWLTDDNDTVHIFSKVSATPVTKLLPANSVAVIPDSVRNCYWVIGQDKIQLIHNGDGVILTTISRTSPDSIVDAEVAPHTGDLYWIDGDGVFVHCTVAGTKFEDNAVVYADLSWWRNTDVLLTSGSLIYLYNGSSVYGYYAQGTTILSVTTKGGTGYFSNDVGVYSFDANFGSVTFVDGGASALKYLGIAQGADSPAYFWSKTGVVEVGSLVNETGFRGVWRSMNLGSGAALTAVLSPLAPCHAWVRTGVNAGAEQSTSSSSSFSSTSSSSTAFASETSSRSSSTKVSVSSSTAISVSSSSTKVSVSSSSTKQSVSSSSTFASFSSSSSSTKVSVSSSSTSSTAVSISSSSSSTKQSVSSSSTKQSVSSSSSSRSVSSPSSSTAQLDSSESTQISVSSSSTSSTAFSRTSSSTAQSVSSSSMSSSSTKVSFSSTAISVSSSSSSKSSSSTAVSISSSSSSTGGGIRVIWSAMETTFLTNPGGAYCIPMGAKIQIGTLGDNSEADMQALADNPVAVAAAFQAWDTKTIGAGINWAGGFYVDSHLPGRGFFGKQIYLLVFNTSNPATAYQVGLFTNPAWQFPAEHGPAETFEIATGSGTYPTGLSIVIGDGWTPFTTACPGSSGYDALHLHGNMSSSVSSSTKVSISSSSSSQEVPLSGPWFQLGRSGKFKSSTSGSLMLYFNDNYYADNTGAYTVTINGVTVSVSGKAGTDTGGTFPSLSGGVVWGAVTAGQTYYYTATGTVGFNNSGSYTGPDPTDLTQPGDGVKSLAVDGLMPGLYQLTLTGRVT